MNTKRDYIINELMVEGFAEWTPKTICLEETEDSGKSKLDFQLMLDGNLSIKNVDCKNTQIQFFKSEKAKSMLKRVDHIIFENLGNNDWKLHLIEMKSSVQKWKWVEVKGKFRASYLLAKGIAAMLDMNIVDTCMYTTYENVHFESYETMPVAKRFPPGNEPANLQDEWDGIDFGLNFGEKIHFVHKPIHMKREGDVLVGSYICE